MGAWFFSSIITVLNLNLSIESRSFAVVNAVCDIWVAETVCLDGVEEP